MQDFVKVVGILDTPYGATLDGVREVRPIRPEERDLWRRLMATHHYLGFRGLVGESLYYIACVETEWVALLGCAVPGISGLGGRAPSNGRGCALS